MDKLYFRPKFLIDGVGGLPLENMAVSVVGEKIVAVTSADTVPDGFREIDARGKTLMPGLLNAHVHLGMNPDPKSSYDKPFEFSLLIQQQMGELLRSGVTYVRNQGSPDYYDIMAQRAAEKGLLEGPELMTSGPALTIAGGHGEKLCAMVCSGVEGCRKAAEDVADHGVGALKIMATGGVLTEGSNLDAAQFSPEEMRVMTEVARQRGLISSVHAHGATGMRQAVEAGVTTVEHGTFIDDDIVEKMLQQGTWLVPTLAAPHSIKSMGLAGGIAPHIMEKMNVVYDIRMASFRKAYKAGVRIGCGTDAGTPNNHFSKTWFELHMMVENGVSPMEALHIGTLKTAHMMGLDKEYGSIEPQKMADILLLEGNPLEGMEVLKSPCTILKKGKVAHDTGNS